MTSLLASVREDAEVVAARKELARNNTAALHAPEWKVSAEAYDTALLRAAVRVIAAKVATESCNYGAAHPAVYGLRVAADFIEGSLE